MICRFCLESKMVKQVIAIGVILALIATTLLISL